ncbi:MAG: HEAT repeat domain-containing protein [Cyanobacteria bacterium]|nr:HEAT repeat domain-containing protein [Cyanobacteriota bacterium]MDW8201835.1 HEAT repeat domain-containing protein [Cyanobacteriota bacterium SKYGB_h_bin112]
MYSSDDLTVVDELSNGLDQAEPIEDVPPPDPDEMLVWLESPDPQQRMRAARAFCDIQDARVVPHLLRLLTDDCPLVRVSVAYALGKNPSADAVEPLITQLATDLNGYVRKGVAWALGNCRDRRALQPLIETLRTDISAVRLWAASALAQMATLGYETVVAAIPPLIEALRRDKVAAVRSNCAWALGQLCREMPSNVVYATAIDALIEAFAEDEEMGVREDARAAILRVGDTRGLQVIEELERQGWF